ncbi:JmjC domain-containing protein [Kitasatospora sp. NPDC101176]|uniref:JmjC domain-containing protein n=1 Tax=Kitasatospora sp. NPDC101176 TaxID=3364099 RepID=UPI0037F4DD3C
MTQNWLHRCVADETHFRTALWRTAPAVLRPADPPLEVLTRPELARLLDHGLLRIPYIGLHQGAAELPAHRFCRPRAARGQVLDDCADGPSVRALVRDERVTVLLRHVEQWHTGVRALAAGLGARLGLPVRADCVLAAPGGRDHPGHGEDGDVLALQLWGTGRWRVHAAPATEAAPASGAGPAAAGAGELLPDTVLRPGEVLYVPRGLAHAARAEGDEPSAHLALTAREPATADLRAVAQALLTDGCDLPERPLDEAALTAAAADLLAHATRVLDQLTPADLLAVTRAVQLRGLS